MADIEVDPGEIAAIVKDAGVAGAGGAGFPSYAKWADPDAVSHFLMNHQESEPDFYSDKWLARERPGVFADLFDALGGAVFDAVVVGTKIKYEDDWLGPLVDATGADVVEPDGLPLDPDGRDGVTVAFTEDDYMYSEEPILLMQVADVQLMGDLPTEHGWVVQNTETCYNIARALADGTPVTEKYVVVDGDTAEHRLFRAPIGTPAEALLAEAGVDAVADDQVLLDGGPGWCMSIDGPVAEVGISKRTNALLLVDGAVAEEHRDEWEEIRVNLLAERDWAGREHETEPADFEPDRVRIPLMTNAAHEGVVEPAVPTVEAGEAVSVGDEVAAAADDGISIPHHASIDGTVADVTDTHVVVER